MDVYCPNCGEPWDHDSMHEEVEARGLDATYDQIAAEFRRRGCAALIAGFGMSDCARRTIAAEGRGVLTRSAETAEARAARVVYDVLGDDMDGAAAMLEDHLG